MKEKFDPWDTIERLAKEVGWMRFEDKIDRKLRTGWTPKATNPSESRQEFLDRLRKEIDS